jgi:hypothetical protein
VVKSCGITTGLFCSYNELLLVLPFLQRVVPSMTTVTVVEVVEAFGCTFCLHIVSSSCWDADTAWLKGVAPYALQHNLIPPSARDQLPTVYTEFVSSFQKHAQLSFQGFELLFRAARASVALRVSVNSCTRTAEPVDLIVGTWAADKMGPEKYIGVHLDLSQGGSSVGQCVEAIMHAINEGLAIAEKVVGYGERAKGQRLSLEAPMFQTGVEKSPAEWSVAHCTGLIGDFLRHFSLFPKTLVVMSHSLLTIMTVLVSTR